MALSRAARRRRIEGEPDRHDDERSRRRPASSHHAAPARDNHVDSTSSWASYRFWLGFSLEFISALQSIGAERSAFTSRRHRPRDCPMPSDVGDDGGNFLVGQFWAKGGMP